MSVLNKSGLLRLWEHILALANNKVDKEEGKGLSTNDFTNEYKNMLLSGGNTGGSAGGSAPFVIDITMDSEICARHDTSHIPYDEILKAVRKDPNSVYIRIFYEDPYEWDGYEGTEDENDPNYLFATTPVAILRFTGEEVYYPNGVLPSLHFSGHQLYLNILTVADIMVSEDGLESGAIEIYMHQVTIR